MFWDPAANQESERNPSTPDNKSANSDEEWVVDIIFLQVSWYQSPIMYLVQKFGWNNLLGFENNFEEIISNWAHDDYLIQEAWYTTERKFWLEYKFCWLAYGKFAKFKICLLSYF